MFYRSRVFFFSFFFIFFFFFWRFFFLCFLIPEHCYLAPFFLPTVSFFLISIFLLYNIMISGNYGNDIQILWINYGTVLVDVTGDAQKEMKRDKTMSSRETSEDSH
ncbi:hypothetical protein L873DRAFT_426199 [Choiromyces venosus 120613-1]|uniref:Uncharacterized protein n=1 Tax=Choiromyces venosus 120613-1 TaxID=1336337 RepID=A0A3N4JZI5_9PEZI|nr:hypothetical protein L873DRAFT_426199 [Choiromyces venosus 120613-1]